MSLTLMRAYSALAGLLSLTGCFPVFAHPTRVSSGFFDCTGSAVRSLVMLGASLSFTLMTPYRPGRR